MNSTICINRNFVICMNIISPCILYRYTYINDVTCLLFMHYINIFCRLMKAINESRRVKCDKFTSLLHITY